MYECMRQNTRMKSTNLRERLTEVLLDEGRAVKVNSFFTDQRVRQQKSAHLSRVYTTEPFSTSYSYHPMAMVKCWCTKSSYYAFSGDFQVTAMSKAWHISHYNNRPSTTQLHHCSEVLSQSLQSAPVQLSQCNHNPCS